MTINPDVVDYIRTLVKGQHETNDQIESRLNEHGWDGYINFLNAIFFYSIDHRFKGKVDRNAIVQFVAEMRTEIEGGPEIDATTAEAMVTSVLDPTADFDAAPEMLAKIQTLGTYKALTDSKPSEAELEMLLAKATRFAEETA